MKDKGVFLKYTMLLIAGGMMAMGMAACSDDEKIDDIVDVTKEQNEAIEALTRLYLSDVVYPTYGNLAEECEVLYNKIGALKAKLKAGTAVSQADIDAICTSYKTARKYWEQSEAFLYGAASDFEIDPHIDTWPLDVPTLGEDLADDAKIQRLDAADGIEYARTSLTAENLGFHGIEFIFFRNGKNRSAAFFNNDEQEDDSDITAKGNVTAKEEVIFATAVAGDLRDKCFQLEVAWNANASGAHKSRVAECAKTSNDFETKVSKNGLTYGENLIAVNNGNSTYNSWKKVVEEILVGGCSNICAEVADQKMGQAYRAATGNGNAEDDPNYIESPYSHNSFTDFYGNIMSIQNALYNNVEGSSPAGSSVMSYLQKYNASEAATLQAKLSAALAALQTCQNSGKSFVEAPGATCVKAAMDAIEDLDDVLNEAANWILRN